ncbi:MAG: pyridoxal phosphate-dependent decarboxylase family protein [Rhodothermales bacterium]
MDLKEHLGHALDAIAERKAGWGPHTPYRVPGLDAEAVAGALDEYTGRLRGNYPFFHPRYAGQMLKPPHPAAIIGYLAAMRINPNNHALDGGPPTAEMEKEVVKELAAMFHLPGETLGHLTTSGTIATLEALWVARERTPQSDGRLSGKAIAFSEAAHYTHGRMSGVLGMETVTIPTDVRGRMDLEALEEALQTGEIGTVVVTAGTTSLGAVDPIADVLALRERYGFRLHADAAYGGFFALLAWNDEDEESLLSEDVRRHYRAIAQADSVALDPHKHGLQPYGCGCILFRDPDVGRLYQHDSPYTYFTSDALHLGEISLECSRAGAAAGALWLTLRLLPLRASEGFGPILARCLDAAQRWSTRLATSDVLQPYVPPELDIVTFFPRPDVPSASQIDQASQRLFREAMEDEGDPVFLSVLRVKSERLREYVPGLKIDQDEASILRSVLMKPEHAGYVGHLHARLTELAAAAHA